MSVVDEVGAADNDMVRGRFAPRLSSPMAFVWTMVIFLIITAFLAAILFRQAYTAFMTNPGLNGFILGVLLIGIILVFSHVVSLQAEVRWFNSFQAAGSADRVGREPKLLAPMRALIGTASNALVSPVMLRPILDSVATRLDESRETSRYLIGLLVFLGLLGTFWGLIGTIGSISTVIQSLDPNAGDSSDVLTSLKSGLTAPLSGMGTAFSSSLLGLSGSLILGFLDLQAGRAQNRFYGELENWLSGVTASESDAGGDGIVQQQTIHEMRLLTGALVRVRESDMQSGERSAASTANLAAGIQELVKTMRSEQQMLRDWIEAQQEETKALRRTLDRLVVRIDGSRSSMPRVTEAEDGKV